MPGDLGFKLFRFGQAASRTVPPPIAYPAIGLAGRVLYALNSQLRQDVIDNMRHVLGPGGSEARARALARRVCGNLIRSYYDLFRREHQTAEDLKNRMQVEGWDNLRAAMAPGKGVIIVGLHYGCLDVMIHIPPIYGIPATGVILHIQPEWLFQAMLHLRTVHGLRMVPSDGPMLAIFRALKRGEMVGLACDRAIGGDGARPVPLFGQPAWLPDGPVQVALRTGAPLVASRAMPGPRGTIRVEIEPPIWLAPTGDEEADIRAGMRRLVDTMERWIAEHPDQWLMSVPLWAAAPYGP